MGAATRSICRHTSKSLTSDDALCYRRTDGQRPDGWLCETARLYISVHVHSPLPQYIKAALSIDVSLYKCTLFVYTWNHSRVSSSFVMLLSSSFSSFLFARRFPGASNFNPRRRYYFFPYIAPCVCVCCCRWGCSAPLIISSSSCILRLSKFACGIKSRLAPPYQHNTAVVAALNNQSSTTTTTLTFDSFYISSIISYISFCSPTNVFE